MVCMDQEQGMQQIPVDSSTVRHDRELREIEVVITTRDVDRQGDIIEPLGLDFANYNKNPVVLWAHDQERPPIAKVVKIVKKVDRIEAVIKFADTEFAQEVFSLYCEGYLNGWSLGFIPGRWKRNPAVAEGRHIFEAEVVEVSAVPVPANPNSLSTMIKSVQSYELKSMLQGMPMYSVNDLMGCMVDVTFEMVDRVCSNMEKIRSI